MSEEDRKLYEVLSPLQCDGKRHMPAKNEDEQGDLVLLDPKEAEHLIGREIVRGPVEDPARKKASGSSSGAKSSSSDAEGSAAKSAGGRSRTKKPRSKSSRPEKASGGAGARSQAASTRDLAATAAGGDRSGSESDTPPPSDGGQGDAP